MHDVTISEKIDELYAKDAAAERYLRMRFKGESLLQNIRANPPADTSLQTLDRYEHAHDLSILLNNLPTSAKEAFETQLLLWTYTQYPFTDEKNDETVALLAKRMRISADRIESARLAAWRIFNTRSGALIKRTLDLEMDLTNHLDVPPLQEYALPGITLSPARLTQYGFIPMFARSYKKGDLLEEEWGEKRMGEKLFMIYLDTPCALALTYKDIPQALVGFIPSDERTLLIDQLQGVIPYFKNEQGKYSKGSSRGLAPLDWTRLLVEKAEAIARSHDFSTLAIQSGENNQWARRPKGDGTSNLPYEKALERYDDLAARLHFTQREDENWYKAIAARAA
ncbi:MAG: hypothetical protein V1725_06915 [archaeon]